MFARRLTLFLPAMLLLAGASQAQTVKPPLRGLISMGAYSFVWMGGDPVNRLGPLERKAGIFGGLVVVATWNQLQPTANAVIGKGNAIDQALAKVRRYNKLNPQKPIGVRLRVWGGFEAPDWAKSIGGDPIATVHNGRDRTVGRFWLPAYLRAWTRLQQQLAALYDNEPLIQEVSVTACMSFTAEPFYVPMDDTVLPELQAAGFNPQVHKYCLNHAIGTYAAWQQSRLVLSVNPLRSVPVSQGPADAEFTKRVMHNCRETLGVRCVFDNHDLDTNLAPPLLPIYHYMKRQGPEIVFQTANATPENFDGTIRMGVRYGASAIELYQDLKGKGFPIVPDAQLRKWAALIEANPADPPQE
jgi:hypothetical protein